MTDDHYFSDIVPKLQELLVEFVPKLGLEDRSDVETLSEALALAYYKGAEAGEVEITAQAIEQGANVTFHKTPDPDSP